MISLMRKKQNFVTLSMIEEKYIVASMARYEIVWLRNIFGDLCDKVVDMTVTCCDDKTGIQLG